MGNQQSPEVNVSLVQELIDRATLNSTSISDRIKLESVLSSIPHINNFYQVWNKCNDPECENTDCKSKICAGGKTKYNGWTNNLRWYLQLNQPYGKVELSPDIWNTLNTLSNGARHERCGNLVCTCYFRVC